MLLTQHEKKFLITPAIFHILNLLFPSIMLTLLPTDCINILNNILKGWVCPEGCKQVTLVQKSVDQVRVMVQ